MALEVFADTAGMAAYLSADEPQHDEALAAVIDLFEHGRRLVTTGLVVGESVSLSLRLPVPRAQVVAFIEGLAASPHVVVVHFDAALQAAG